MGKGMVRPKEEWRLSDALDNEADMNPETGFDPVQPILRPHSMRKVDYPFMGFSSGVDAAKDDPIGVLSETEAEFSAAVRRIARTGLPMAVIYELRCLWEALPRNRVAFLDGLKQCG